MPASGRLIIQCFNDILDLIFNLIFFWNLLLVWYYWYPLCDAYSKKYESATKKDTNRYANTLTYIATVGIHEETEGCNLKVTFCNGSFIRRLIYQLIWQINNLNRVRWVFSLGTSRLGDALPRRRRPEVKFQ